MAIKFEGGKTRNLKHAFDERKEYKDYEGFKLFRTLDTHYVDFKYGMMNRDYEPICLISEQRDVSLQNFPDFAPEVKVLPFVAIAFNDFRKAYKDFVDNSRDPSVGYPKFLDDVIPLRGYANLSTDYAAYANYNMEVHKKILGNDPEIKTYEIFVKKFFDIYIEKGQEFPITKSGFITSQHCSIMSTGLCLEFAEEDYDIDEPKGEMITTSDFHCFADYANHFGFLVDKYVPWRLVADLRSPKMREYIVKGKNHRPSRAMDLYESLYTTRSHYDDMYLLSRYLLSMYNIIYQANKDIMQPIPPLDVSHHVETLLKVRCIELGVYDENFEELKNKVLDIYGKYGVRYTQGYIGQLASDHLRKIYEPK